MTDNVHRLSDHHSVSGEPHEGPKDDKYITIKRSDLESLLMELGVRTPDAEGPAEWGIDTFESYALHDSVVIRTQDAFAGPALHSYAYTMSLVARATDDKRLRVTLLSVADYFSERAHEADEIHWAEESKHPD